jgi:CO/xanthine dehydrogenase Mo-binding subunit
MNNTPKSKSPHDSTAKMSGETKFLHDMNLLGQLVGGTLRSPHSHARIVSIDVTVAKQIEGVKAVITSKDVPKNEFGPTRFKDWNILADEKVLFIGDEVAAVAAETKEAVATALKAIKVEYEVLPAVYEPEEALKPTAPIVHDSVENNQPMLINVERGNVEDAVKKAHIVRGGRFVINPIYQGHLEPIGVLANWTEDEVTIWAGSHIPYRARETYASAFGLPEDKVRIIVPPIGGSFGSKYVLKVHLIAAALSKQAKRPVKMILNRYEDMITSHPRVPLIIDVQIGADKDGKFVYKDAVVYGNAGARIYWSPNIVGTACTRPDSVYHFNNVRAKGHLCYTNVSPTTCMRGFGNAEMLYAIENVIDEIAEGLSMDPAELRLKNIVHENDTTIHGYKLRSCKLDKCIEKVKEISGWNRREMLPPNKGIGMAVANHVSGYSAIDPRFDGSTAVMRLKSSGDIEVETGEIDLGQGMTQAYAEIAKKVVGLETTNFVVKSGDTGRYPFGIGTLASRSTVMGGNAVQLAAEQFKSKLLSFLEERFNNKGEFHAESVRVGDNTYSLEEIAGFYRSAHAGEELVIRATYVPDTELPDSTFYGDPSPNYPFAAHVAEVEVDPDTGKTKVTGYWAVHDSGVIIHQVRAKSQVIGAVAQGIGWVTMEELKYADGKVQNPSILDYRMPGAADIPDIHVEFIEEPDPNGPLGAKSVGEVALDPVPGAIANAIAHAIGIRGHELPLTPEKVWLLKQQ